MKGEKVKKTKVEITGRLLTQEINGKNIVVLSEEATACVKNLSAGDNLRYTLSINNMDKTAKSNWEVLNFDIKLSMSFASFTFKNMDFLQWFTEKNVYYFEVLLDESNERITNNFWKILEQCLCSLKKNISIERAGLQIKKSSFRYIREFGEIFDLSIHSNQMIKQLAEQNKKDFEEKMVKAIKNLEIKQPKLGEVLNLKVAKKIFSTEGEIFNYDTKKETLVPLIKGEAAVLSIYKLDSQKFEYILCVENMNGLLISFDRISEELNGQIMDYQESYYFCWMTDKCYVKSAGDCLGFFMKNPKDRFELRKILDKCLYESKSKMPYDKVEKENRELIEKSTDYRNINCFSSDEEEKEEKPKYKNRPKKNRKEIMDLDDKKYSEAESIRNAINKLCLDSLSNDRTFCVTDDNQIDVYKSNFDDNTIEKVSSLPVVQEYDGNDVCFSHGLLYKSENNVLLLDENNPYIIFQYDLPKKTIVNVWKTENTRISDICTFKKGGQKTDEPIIYGVNPKAVFTLDERVSNNNNIVEKKIYTTRNDANIIMSNYNGQFATGNIKGELRLYDNVNKKAKNLFSFYEDPIRSIDISSDDQYALLTFDKYLILINLGNGEGEKNAFLKTVKTEERKTPLRLQIKTTDIAKYGLAHANYANAKFNVNKNGENNIITSLGEYIIMWNYNDIRKGKISNYKIKKVGDLIVDNYFKVGGQGDKIIIAMPNKVRIQKQKKIFG